MKNLPGKYIYSNPTRPMCRPMERLYRTTLFALYQLTLLVGIMLMPVALVTQRLGFRLPIDRAVLSLKESYEHAR